MNQSQAISSIVYTREVNFFHFCASCLSASVISLASDVHWKRCVVALTAGGWLYPTTFSGDFMLEWHEKVDFNSFGGGGGVAVEGFLAGT